MSSREIGYLATSSKEKKIHRHSIFHPPETMSPTFRSQRSEYVSAKVKASSRRDMVSNTGCVGGMVLR